MAEAPLLPGRDYLMKIGTRTVGATVAPLKHRVDVETFEPVPATRLEQNEVGVCQLQLGVRTGKPQFGHDAQQAVTREGHVHDQLQL